MTGDASCQFLPWPAPHAQGKAYRAPFQDAASYSSSSLSGLELGNAPTFSPSLRNSRRARRISVRARSQVVASSLTSPASRPPSQKTRPNRPKTASRPSVMRSNVRIPFKRGRTGGHAQSGHMVAWTEFVPAQRLRYCGGGDSPSGYALWAAPCSSVGSGLSGVALARPTWQTGRLHRPLFRRPRGAIAAPRRYRNPGVRGGCSVTLRCDHGGARGRTDGGPPPWHAPPRHSVLPSRSAVPTRSTCALPGRSLSGLCHSRSPRGGHE